MSVKVFLKNLGKTVLTVSEGQETSLPSTQPERASLFIKGGKRGGWYLTGLDPYGPRPSLEDLRRIKPGERVPVDSKAVLIGA